MDYGFVEEACSEEGITYEGTIKKINAKTSDEQTLIFSRPKPQAKKAV